MWPRLISNWPVKCPLPPAGLFYSLLFYFQRTRKQVLPRVKYMLTLDMLGVIVLGQVTSSGNDHLLESLLPLIKPINSKNTPRMTSANTLQLTPSR